MPRAVAQRRLRVVIIIVVTITITTTLFHLRLARSAHVHANGCACAPGARLERRTIHPRTHGLKNIGPDRGIHQQAIHAGLPQYDQVVFLRRTVYVEYHRFSTGQAHSAALHNKRKPAEVERLSVQHDGVDAGLSNGAQQTGLHSGPHPHEKTTTLVGYRLGRTVQVTHQEVIARLRRFDGQYRRLLHPRPHRNISGPRIRLWSRHPTNRCSRHHYEICAAKGGDVLIGRQTVKTDNQEHLAPRSGSTYKPEAH